MSRSMSLLDRSSAPFGTGVLGPSPSSHTNLHPKVCSKANILRGSRQRAFGNSDIATSTEQRLPASSRREARVNLALAFSLFDNGAESENKKQKRARGRKQVCRAHANEHQNQVNVQHWARQRRVTPLQVRIEAEEWGSQPRGSKPERLETAGHVTLATGTSAPSMPFASARSVTTL